MPLSHKCSADDRWHFSAVLLLYVLKIVHPGTVFVFTGTSAVARYGLTLNIVSGSGLHGIERMLRYLKVSGGGQQSWLWGWKACPVRRA